jgi:RHS repeat-associated protein
MAQNQTICDALGYSYDAVTYVYDSPIAVHDTAAPNFTGKERDAESGLDYFGARYYGSTLGRFMTPDTGEIAEPLPYADLDDPQTLNLYGYVRNNPLSLVDPDGHMTCAPKPSDPGTIICEPVPPPKKDPPKEEPSSDPCGFLCQQVFHTPQSQRTWDLSARVTNKYIATPLLTFLSFAVPGALEAAGPSVEASLGTAIVSGATKAAAKQAVEHAVMTGAQKAAVKRAIARATTKETVSVERLADGSVRVLLKRPGANGFQVISKVAGTEGKTATAQIGVEASGEISHYDPK